MSPVPTARDRIVDAAYALFSSRGVRDVGINEVVERADVAKATLYKHFPTKDDLVEEFLRRRERQWTMARVLAGARARGTTAEERLLAIFDVFDEWFRSEEFDACAFITTLVEMGPGHRLGRASIGHLEAIRAGVAQLADEAGVPAPAEFAHSWHILMKGSIIAATEGDRDAARRAQAMARCLLDEHLGRR